MKDPGWILWGLFAACFAIVAGYTLWMWWVERP